MQPLKHVAAGPTHKDESIERAVNPSPPNIISVASPAPSTSSGLTHTAPGAGVIHGFTGDVTINDRGHDQNRPAQPAQNKHGFPTNNSYKS